MTTMGREASPQWVFICADYGEKYGPSRSWSQGRAPKERGQRAREVGRTPAKDCEDSRGGPTPVRATLPQPVSSVSRPHVRTHVGAENSDW